MSCDIVIFSTKQINSFEQIDEEHFLPRDFNAVLEKYFENIIVCEKRREIKGENFSIEYFTDTEPVSNTSFNLYGEAALFELIRVAKNYGWQIFDTGNGEMLHLEHPEKNGYSNFQSYLK